MWRSQIGSKEVKTITQGDDDDDWETDPDFVVRSSLHHHYIITISTHNITTHV